MTKDSISSETNIFIIDFVLFHPILYHSHSIAEHFPKFASTQTLLQSALGRPAMSITWGYQWLSKPRGKDAASPFLQLYRPRYWEGDTVARYKIAVGNSKSLGFVAWRVPPSPPTSPSLHVFRVLKWGDCSWIKQLAAKIAPDIFKSHHWITIDHHHHPSHLNYHLYNLHKENKQTISRKRPKMKKRPVDRGATHASIIFGHCRALDWRLHWSGPENHCKPFSKANSLFFLWRRCSRNRRTPHNLWTSLWSSSWA